MSRTQNQNRRGSTSFPSVHAWRLVAAWATVCVVCLGLGTAAFATEEKVPGACHAGDPYHGNNDPVHDPAGGNACDGIAGVNIGGCTRSGSTGNFYATSTLECIKEEGEGTSRIKVCHATISCMSTTGGSNYHNECTATNGASAVIGVGYIRCGPTNLKGCGPS